MNKYLKFFLNMAVLSAIIVVVGFVIGYNKDFSSFDSHPSLSNSPIISTTDTTKIITHPDIDWSKVHIDKVAVYKATRRMDLLEDGKVVQSYPIRLGFTPEGHKTTEGDGKTPEGKYQLDWRNPNSLYYKSLHISYPNPVDVAQADARGVSAGGDIMIHGTAKKTAGSKGEKFYDYLPRGDWTLGCISVSNKNIDEIWQGVNDGTEIEIFP